MSLRRIVFAGVVSLCAASVSAWAGCSFDSSSPDAGVDEGDIHQGFGPEGEYGERRITFLSYPRCGMDAHQNLVVYSDCRDLYLVDIDRETEWHLSGSFMSQFSHCSYPSIDNGVVAFADFEYGEGGDKTYSVSICDINGENGLSLQGTSAKSYPIIMDRRVVWQDHRFQNLNDPDPANRHNSEVFMYDPGEGVERRITNAANHQVHPDIFGDYIVWHDERDIEQIDVWLYRISTGEEFNISNHPSDQITPSVWGDKVVWSDLRNGTGDAKYTYENLDVYLYDITTGRTRQITDDPSDQEWPHIHGRYITWNDMRNGSRPVEGGSPSGADVYLYDLETDEEKRVTWHEGNDGAARVAGDKIIWYTGRDGVAALYMKPLDAL